MKYKLSNTATQETLEEYIGIPLKYPNIYKPTPLISGLEETFIPIVTSNKSKVVEYGIWGLLPKNYDEDWGALQENINTLTTYVNSKSLIVNPSNLKRCAVFVTGFFTNYLHNGQIFPFYVYAKNKKPFYLAGYYNRINDGFITFSILLEKSSPDIKKIQNLSPLSPKLLTKKECDIWISESGTDETVKELIQKPSSLDINFHSIAKELYKMGISYTSMLDPVVYSCLSNIIKF